MRIGILGGSFDPPHIGHLLVARQTREIVKLDEVWLMPYFAHNWDTTASSAKDRFVMTKLLEENGIIASGEEINRHERSYTIDTVIRLKKKFPQDSFFWIVGSDVLSEFHRWKEWERLPSEITFLVFPRVDYPSPATFPIGFQAVISASLVMTNISSSLIRQRIRKHLTIDNLVPSRVSSYILQQRLYQ